MLTDTPSSFSTLCRGYIGGVCAFSAATLTTYTLHMWSTYQGLLDCTRFKRTHGILSYRSRMVLGPDRNLPENDYADRRFNSGRWSVPRPCPSSPLWLNLPSSPPFSKSKMSRGRISIGTIAATLREKSSGYQPVGNEVQRPDWLRFFGINLIFFLAYFSAFIYIFRGSSTHGILYCMSVYLITTAMELTTQHPQVRLLNTRRERSIRPWPHPLPENLAQRAMLRGINFWDVSDSTMDMTIGLRSSHR